MEQVGTVKWFDESKGYGFITPVGGGPDIFVHFTNIQAEGFKTLYKGQQVQFQPYVGPKGPSALSVVVTQDIPDKQKQMHRERMAQAAQQRATIIASTSVEAEEDEGIEYEEDE